MNAYNRLTFTVSIPEALKKADTTMLRHWVNSKLCFTNGDVAGYSDSIAKGRYTLTLWFGEMPDLVAPVVVPTPAPAPAKAPRTRKGKAPATPIPADEPTPPWEDERLAA